MTTRQVIEAVLMTVAAVLVAAGAIVIQPLVIGGGCVAATAALILRMTDKRISMPPRTAIPAHPTTEPTLDLLLLSAEQAEQMSALYDLLSKDAKPRLVAQDGETALELPDAVCELLLKVVGGLQQGKAISIRVAEEPTDSAS
jgi:hypothetical protein